MIIIVVILKNQSIIISFGNKREREREREKKLLNFIRSLPKCLIKK
jgi:hypothetical protein